jgi:hypothetical protein
MVTITDSRERGSLSSFRVRCAPFGSSRGYFVWARIEIQKGERPRRNGSLKRATFVPDLKSKCFGKEIREDRSIGSGR